MRNGRKSPIFIGTFCRSPALQEHCLSVFTKGVICLIGRSDQRVRRGVRRVPVLLLALAAFVVFGVLFGYVLALRSAQRTGGELERYVSSFFSFGAKEPFSVQALCETLVCYFRAPVIVFLLGFASIGVMLVPAVCAFQGFLLSFSLFSFSLALGRGNFPLLLALFGLRMLAVLPCILVLGAAAMEKSRALLLLSLGGGGKRTRAVTYGSAYWYRLGGCCVCLLLAALAELWLVPQFLLLAAR